MTMEVTPNTDSTEEANEAPDPERDDLIASLTNNENICFKSQQRWEPDLSQAEKFKIALDIFLDNKLTFLIKFGKYLNREQLCYFQKCADKTNADGDEINLLLTDLFRSCSNSGSATVIKNRRYGAMRKMIQEDSYFSEIEMMKRNPLLYDQLVGQYLTAEEVKERNRYEMNENASFVNILMEGIERDNAELQRKQQEQDEDGQIEEEEDDSSDGENETPAPSYSRWGEFESEKLHRPKPKVSTGPITAHERVLLKQEFVTTMYQNFLEGKDEDFNYSNVDTDPSLDVLEEIDNDEEEKYFESEEPMDVGLADCSSEDELDMYMNALQQHPGVTELSNDLKKL